MASRPMADQRALPIIGDRTRACGGIGRRARLRALWGVSPVGVRVSLGALSKPAPRAGFAVLEAGKRDPRVSTVAKLAKALDVATEELLRGL